MPDSSFFFKRSEILPFVEMRRANKSTACYHTHSHDEFSFGVIDEGEATYQNLSQNNHIGTGHTVTINPGDAHSCNPNDGAWSYRMLFVDTNWIGKIQQEIFDNTSQDYWSFLDVFESNQQSYIQFSNLFNSLINCSNQLEVESRLIQFIAQCFQADSRLVKNNAKVATLPMKNVKEQILDQLDTNLSLQDFSAQSGLSRYHLIRSFKQIYGQSPHAFQLDQRIIKSKILLQQGKTISDTATELGFSDQSHFQRNFKKRIAVTPRQYQQCFI